MPDTLYDRDFYAWTREQAARLRAEATRGNNAPLDWENLAEEVESMGRSDRRALLSRLMVVLVHLLKWLYCPELLERNRRPWRLMLSEQRWRLSEILADSPSLREELKTAFAAIYVEARLRAGEEAEVPSSRFPAVCPFTLEQTMDRAFPADLSPDDPPA